MCCLCVKIGTHPVSSQLHWYYLFFVILTSEVSINHFWSLISVYCNSFSTPQLIEKQIVSSYTMFPGAQCSTTLADGLCYSSTDHTLLTVIIHSGRFEKDQSQICMNISLKTLIKLMFFQTLFQNKQSQSNKFICLLSEWFTDSISVKISFLTVLFGKDELTSVQNRFPRDMLFFAQSKQRIRWWVGINAMFKLWHFNSEYS